MELKLGYKLTETGVIPEEWMSRGLLSAVCIANGQVDPQKDPFRSMVLIAPDHIESGTGKLLAKQTAAEQHAISGKYVFDAGDIIYSKIRPYLKKAILVDFAGLCSADMYPLRPAADVDGGYILPVLLGYRFTKYAESVSVRSGMPKINRAELADFVVAVPPLYEQHSIAAALSDVDALLNGLDRLIAKKRALKQATMQRLLTGQTRLPGFHEEWEVKRLGDLAQLNRQNVVPAREPGQLFVHFSLPAFDAGRGAPTELGSAIGSNKFRVPPNAVLVSKLNPRIPRIWAPTSIPRNAVASTEWLVLTPREGVDRRFLFTLCSSPGVCRRLELAATGTTGSHQRISPGIALDIRVATPSDGEEQTAIAAVLSDMDAELSALQARRDKTHDLKQAMMQELLTGRTRLV